MTTGNLQDPDTPSSVSPIGTTADLWKIPIVCLLLSTLFVAVVFWQNFAQIVDHWTASTAYNHGFLIPLITAYIVYERLDHLRQLKPHPGWLALLFFSGSLAAWLIGTIADVRAIEQFSVISMLQWTVVAVLGWRIGLALAFPLFYLFFAVPFGDFLVPTLQHITALAVIKMLQLSNIPVFYEGIFISIPTGNFVVAEVCSGLRFLLAAVAIGSLMANLMLKQFWRRCLFMALVIIVPIAANGLRAYGIIMLAYWTNNELATGFDHIIYGWVFISLVLIALLGIGYLLRDRNKARTNTTPAPKISGNSVNHKKPFEFAAMVIAVLSLSATGAGAAKFLLAPPTIDVHLQASPIEAGPDWPMVGSTELKWRPLFPNADQVLLRSYRKADSQIDTATVFFHWQRDQAEIVGWQNRMVSTDNWQWLAGGNLALEIGDDNLNTRYSLFRSVDGNRATAIFYFAAGRLTGSARLAKVFQTEATLLAKSPKAAAIILSTRYSGGPAAALKQLQAFAASIKKLGLP